MNLLISSSQIKAARALIGWTSALLAEKSGVGLMTVRRYEAVSGIPDGRVARLMKIKNALETAGVEFLGDPVESPGVRLSPKP